jgi:hypothetical protein
MIEILIVWFIIAITALGLGLFFTRDLEDAFWLGWVITVAVLLVYHLFAPITPIIGVVLCACAGLIAHPFKNEEHLKFFLSRRSHVTVKCTTRSSVYLRRVVSCFVHCGPHFRKTSLCSFTRFSGKSKLGRSPFR